MTWPHPIDPPMGGAVGGGVSTNHKSSNRIELSQLGQDFFKFLVFWLDSTHQPTHPPNNTPTHGWGNLHRFQIFKWNWNISISSSAIKFWLIPGFPLGGGGVGGCGWGVVRGCPPHTCTCRHMHAHACAYDIIGNSQGFPQWRWPFAWNYHVYHAHMCVHVCVCAHVWGHPSTTPHPIHPPPTPQSHREPETPKFNKSWTNWDNSILFEDSLPLNIPELI